LGILRLQVQQLGHDQVGDLVVDRRAQEDDPLVQQAAVYVERPLTARGLLYDHGYEWAHSPRIGFASPVRFLHKASWPACDRRGSTAGRAPPRPPAPPPAPVRGSTAAPWPAPGRPISAWPARRSAPPPCAPPPP